MRRQEGFGNRGIEAPGPPEENWHQMWGRAVTPVEHWPNTGQWVPFMALPDRLRPRRDG